ncbi:MAG: tRNA guanosine(34) transglycosylase Tgt [Spirochaetaceae bacterium]|jgi:queuine tRNA-ribosyltransferase|nr:tRNA guanosine(34) transglycosylase Tgt [Spirochaetaceae bacterium]
MDIFTAVHADTGSNARTGILRLPHGPVSTPVFMPVGTAATVKAIETASLADIGFEIALSNTYHLYLRPGMDVIAAAGGLHRFMNWKRNILTDSGGFQVFSLAPMRKIHENGVEFRSHIDGSKHFFSAEDAVSIQAALGSDIQMQLDVCTAWGVSRTEAEEALRITDRWLVSAREAWLAQTERGYPGFLFPIVQGNFFPDLRRKSAETASASGLPGIAIGGLSVGEEEAVFLDFLASTASLLPREKPRYVMGIGTPEYILAAIGEGIDMFDCVLPTRAARNGLVFSSRGAFNIKRAVHRLETGPLDENCLCKVCREYSRAYLRHLFKNGEILFSMLATYHNLFFLHRLVRGAREAIAENRFLSYRKEFLETYHGGENHP